MESKDILQDIIFGFDTDKFIRFFRTKNRLFAPKKKELGHYDDENFQNGLKLGEINFSNEGQQFTVCAFEVLKKKLSERSGKKAQYEKGKKVLKELHSDAGIFIFYDKDDNFRFSLIYANYLGKKRDWSTFRRFTYFVSQNQTNKTFLQRIGAGDFSTLEKIKDAFSVEKVTKEFYKDIANWYFWAVRYCKFPKDVESEEKGIELDQTVYAFDSTTIDLCLTMFPWAKFRKQKSAIKLHTLIDLRGNIPSFIKITDGKVQDVNILDDLILEPGAFYLMDRGYIDFARLYTMNLCSAFFVTRSKTNTKFRRIYSLTVDKSSGIKCDQIIVLTGVNSKKNYPDKIRRVRYFDDSNNKNLTFLTNNFIFPSLTIAQLYKCRWQVELFFKWIKQHLRIKVFYSTLENAVKTQIWIAVSLYVLIAIIKKRFNLKLSLYTILQILSITAYEKDPILQILTNCKFQKQTIESSNKLLLFDL